MATKVWLDSRPPRTSATHPLRVDWLDLIALVPEWANVRSLSRLGMTFCPGKQGSSLSGAPWKRDLHTDFAVLGAAGVGLVVPLLEPHEYPALGIDDYNAVAESCGVMVLPLPVPDMQAPRDLAAVEAVVDGICSLLRVGGTVVIHCRGGHGRAGTITAAVLGRLGMNAKDAIDAVRSARHPKCVRTYAQERWVYWFLRDVAPLPADSDTMDPVTRWLPWEHHDAPNTCEPLPERWWLDDDSHEPAECSEPGKPPNPQGG